MEEGAEEEQSVPADKLLKMVTAERIGELKEKIQKLHANCTQLHVELNEVNSGKYNTHIELAWDEVQKRKHSEDFNPLGNLVAGMLAEKKAKDEPKQPPPTPKIKEEVLDEGHSSSSSSKSERPPQIMLATESGPVAAPNRPSSIQLTSPVVQGQVQVGTSGPAQPGQHGQPPFPSRSPVSSSPNRGGARLVSSPRLPTGSRIIGPKNKHQEGDKAKVKTLKPQKKKPVVPKIKIKALQMAGVSDPKSLVKGDKKESKITDVFHFDYQPPSGSGINPNAQYSSLFQDPKHNFPEKSEQRSESSLSPAGSAISSYSQNMSPRVDPESLDPESPSYRAWKKSILMLWKTATQHKYAHIFMHPVTDELAPGYSATVRRPIDLTTIKRKIELNETRTTAQFHRDMLLMFHNALMYNNASHNVYSYTVAMMNDVVEVIAAFYSTHNQLPDKHLQKVAVARSRNASIASQ